MRVSRGLLCGLFFWSFWLLALADDRATIYADLYTLKQASPLHFAIAIDVMGRLAHDCDSAPPLRDLSPHPKTKPLLALWNALERFDHAADPSRARRTLVGSAPTPSPERRWKRHARREGQRVYWKAIDDLRCADFGLSRKP